MEIDPIAVVGAVTGVFATALTLYTTAQERRAKRRVVTVSSEVCGLGVIDGPVWTVALTVRNPGERTVTIERAYLLIDGLSFQARSLAAGSDLPHDLEDGKSLTMFYALADVVAGALEAGQSGTLKIRGEVVESGAGTKYTQAGTLFVPLSTWHKFLPPDLQAKIEAPKQA